MSSSAQGVVLAGQPVAVRAGAGITIDTNGIISVDASSVTGLVKLNNPTAYNAYVWPNVDGTTGQFLQTDGAGNLIWADASGYAVVTVQSGAPSPADVGELWFDCATGTLNVYQNCVGTPSPNWFNVAQPGLPVLPANTSAAPAFVSGSGTSGAPYVCNATTVPVSGSAFIVNTVSVSGLAPFQYVPIADLAGVANGGRFSFSNYYADAAGVLTFNTIFNDVPGSPVGTVYTANIKIGYGSAYVDADVTIVAALTTTAGSISGTPQTGQTLTYTTGVASGGTGPYTYAWIWQDDLGATLQTGGATYVVAGGDVGRTISVVLTATDSSLATATATTAPTAIVTVAPFPGTVWAPTPSGGLNNIPGLISGVYSGTGTTITSTGCIEVSTDGVSFSQSEPIASGQTLYARWIDVPSSGTCGDAATGTNLTGDVTDGTYENSYAVTVNRKPNPALADVSDTGIALGATTTKSLAAAVAGLTATAYITLDAASTGTTVQVSTDGGTTFQTVPSAPSTAVPVANGVTIQIRQTVGNTTSTGYTAIINIGDSTGDTGAATTYQTVTYTATTVASAVFPNSPFTPVGGPNASPASVSEAAPFMPVAIEGTATCSNWNDGSPTLNATNMLMSIGLGVAPASASVSPVPTDIVNVAWDPAYISGLADGATATGSFTDTTYTNSYTFTVDKQPAFTLPADPTGAALSTQQTTNAFTPNNFNCPVTVSFTNPTTGGTVAMSNVQYVINGGAAVNVTLGTTTVVINPGDDIEILGDTGGANSTAYGITVTMGAAAAQEWLVTTTAVTNAITAPTMSPTGGPLDPGLNSPAGITIGGGTYTVASGTPGPHTSTDWELYEGSYPLQSANTISGVTQNSLGFAPQTYSPAADVFDLLFDGTNFVTVGNGPHLATSSNGTSWANQTLPVGSPSSLRTIAFGGGKYVAGGFGNNVVVSSNGTVWTLQAITGGFPAFSQVTGSTYAGNKFWIVGSTSSNTGYIYSSPDGVTWTQAYNAGVLGYQSIISNGSGTLVAVGDGSKISTSTDGGTTWSTQTLTFTQPANAINDVSFGNGVFIAVATNGQEIATSLNGVVWSTSTTGLPWGLSQTYVCKYTGGLFYIGGQNGTLATSPDGSTWTDETTALGASEAVRGVAASSSTLVVGVQSSPFIYKSAVPSTTLAIANCQTEGFQVGDTVVSVAAGGGPATILSLDDTQVVVTSSTGWLGTNTQTLARDSSMYTQVVPPPANPNATDLETLLVPQASLTTSSTYYSRARYSASSTSTTSPWANWASFTTTSSFSPPAPGTAMGGGYFAGQIVGAGSTSGAGGLDNAGTIYNLIVAPVSSGGLSGTDTSGIAYRTTAAANGNTNAQNENFGGLCTSEVLAGSATGGAAAYPVFNTFINGAGGPNAGAFNLATGGAGGGTGIGGYNDWYLPAKNELAVLYFFLKPQPEGTSPNNTSSGSNPSSVAPYTPNTNYGVGFPSQTTSTLFQTSGAEAFSIALNYWSATEYSSNTNGAWLQVFTLGNQSVNVKDTSSVYARAVRRVAA